MRRFSMVWPIFIVWITYGCFDSRNDRGKADASVVDASLVDDGSTDTNSGIGGRETEAAGSNGTDNNPNGFDASVIGTMDAGIADAKIEQGGTGGIGVNGGVMTTGGIDDRGVDDDDGGTTIERCTSDCPELDWVTIPAGTFQMGSPDQVGDSDEHPRHEVTVPRFQMSKTEITVSQYAKCVKAGVCEAPSSDGDVYNWDKPGRENHPINGIQWDHAISFCRWLGVRLPTEAEWEYAARSGGQDIIYPWGDEPASCEYAVIDTGVGEYADGWGCNAGTTMEVCSKASGNTAQGLCDMAGNAEEWVADDWHERYDGAPVDGSAWIGDTEEDYAGVVRGGSYDNNPYMCRAVSRSEGHREMIYNQRGFRVARDL